MYKCYNEDTELFYDLYSGTEKIGYISKRYWEATGKN